MFDGPMNIENIMGNMNSNMPVVRRSLLDYIDNGDLTYKTRGGVTCSMEQSEIDLLSDNCTECDKTKLKLPIFVATDTSGSDGLWKVEGITESHVIAKILNRTQFKEDLVRFYNPDLAELRKVLPNSVVILFIL